MAGKRVLHVRLRKSGTRLTLLWHQRALAAADKAVHATYA